LREMTAVSSKSLAKRLAIPVARAAVLPAGAAVVRGLIELARPSEIQAAQSGIRRGLLLAAFAGTI
jgi:exopolyphosphatase/pppGpp-phosphohydrolase